MSANRLGVDATPEALLRYFMHRLYEDGGGPPLRSSHRPVTDTPPEPESCRSRLALLRVATLPVAALAGLAAPAAVARCGEVLDQEERLDAEAAALSDALHAAAGEPPGGKGETPRERAAASP